MARLACTVSLRRATDTYLSPITDYRAMMIHEWRSLPFRLLVCAYDAPPWGVRADRLMESIRADKLMKSGKLPTPGFEFPALSGVRDAELGTGGDVSDGSNGQAAKLVDVENAVWVAAVVEERGLWPRTAHDATHRRTAPPFFGHAIGHASAAGVGLAAAEAAAAAASGGDCWHRAMPLGMRLRP